MMNSTIYLKGRVSSRFRNWTKVGIREKVFNELIKNDIVDYENLCLLPEM